MMRVRLRDYPDAAELAAMYAKPHDHSRFADHAYRVDVTSAIAQLAFEGGTVADLSCGDATIARRLEAIEGAEIILGDFAPGYDYCGPIEETIGQIPHVDMFILSETLEHLDDPDAVLAAIRAKTDTLILSTPDGEQGRSNPEHIWGWDDEAIEEMLIRAGFRPQICNILDLRPAGWLYAFQIWLAS